MNEDTKDKFAEMMKKMIKTDRKMKLGVSIYPEHSTMEQDKAYLDMAAKYGFTRVFTCLLSVGDDVEQIKKEFTEINGYAHSLGMEVIFDVNPIVFEKIGVVGNDFTVFKEMHADGIRLDMGFGPKEDARLTNNPQGLKIEINASTSTDYLEQMIAYGANLDKLMTCHNFYPQLFTGLGLETFLEASRSVMKNNVKVATFVSSNQPNTYGPWPVSEGLVTVEIHRGKPIDFQARHLIATKATDDILIGNAYASEAELASLSELDPNRVTFKVTLMDGITEHEKAILDAVHIQREISDFVKRDLISRFVFGKEDLPMNNAPKELKRGDVIIVNDNLKHYRGELQIALQDLPNDGRYNVVAKIENEELALIDLIETGDNFVFITE